MLLLQLLIQSKLMRLEYLVFDALDLLLQVDVMNLLQFLIAFDFINVVY